MVMNMSHMAGKTDQSHNILMKQRVPTQICIVGSEVPIFSFCSSTRTHTHTWNTMENNYNNIDNEIMADVHADDVTEDIAAEVAEVHSDDDSMMNDPGAVVFLP